MTRQGEFSITSPRVTEVSRKGQADLLETLIGSYASNTAFKKGTRLHSDKANNPGPAQIIIQKVVYSLEHKEKVRGCRGLLRLVSH